MPSQKESKMGNNLTLTADDNHSFGAYRADPDGEAKGGIIVIQEIFGVNEHIRQVCDGFADDGYVAIAPALFDRSESKNCQLGYTPDDIASGREIMQAFSWDLCMKDIQAVVEVIKNENLRIGTVGYCWGGSISYLCCTRLPVQASVVYYGGQIMPYIDEKEGCPLLMHFGEHDAGIPIENVKSIVEAHPAAVVHIYDADHGFNCDHRTQYNKRAADLARTRTMELFSQHLN